jgi:hypothetical protein
MPFIGREDGKPNLASHRDTTRLAISAALAPSQMAEELSGMDQGSDFECEFRARRIRLRGTSHTKRFTICAEIIDNYGPCVPRPHHSHSFN